MIIILPLHLKGARWPISLGWLQHRFLKPLGHPLNCGIASDLLKNLCRRRPGNLGRRIMSNFSRFFFTSSWEILSPLSLSLSPRLNKSRLLHQQIGKGGQDLQPYYRPRWQTMKLEHGRWFSCIFYKYRLKISASASACKAVKNWIVFVAGRTRSSKTFPPNGFCAKTTK